MSITAVIPTNLVKLLLFKAISIYYCRWLLWNGKILALLQSWALCQPILVQVRLLQETYPGWLYPVKMGATTIWERWDGIKPDSTFQTPGMNSFNHYAYGAIGDWMYRVVAGIDTYEDGVGYKHIRIKPIIGDSFNYASASLQSYYGKVSCAWKKESDKTILDIEIPVNTKATLYIPASSAGAITESGSSISSSKEIIITGNDGGFIILTVGSGTYKFEVSNK